MLTAKRVSLNGDQSEIKAVYDFWRESWAEEFRAQNLDGIDTKTSDEFRNADLLTTLEFESRPVSLMITSHFDLARPWDLADSYFKGWPPQALKLFKGQVTALRYFVVDPALRTRTDLRLGQTILAVCLSDFLHSESEALIGMTLKKFGAQNLAKKFGMQSVGSSEKHGVPVEYVTVTKAGVNERLVEKLTSQVINGPWAERRLENLAGIVGDKKAS